MMKIKYFKTKFEQKLRDDVENNLDRYYSKSKPWVDEYFAGAKFDESVELDIKLPLLEKTTPSSDAENAILLFSQMKNLSPSQASDPRLWSHLCHKDYYNYVHKRWDEKDGFSKEKILDRFFIRSVSNTRPLVRNALSRLWWYGYLTYDPKDTDVDNSLTKVLLSYQDIQQVLLEHSYGKNRKIVRAFLKAIRVNMGKLKSSNAKPFIHGLAKYVNHLGSVTFLDVLDETTLFEKMNEYLKKQ